MVSLKVKHTRHTSPTEHIHGELTTSKKCHKFNSLVWMLGVLLHYIKAIEEYHIHLPSKLTSTENTSFNCQSIHYISILQDMADLLGPAPRCGDIDRPRQDSRKTFRSGETLEDTKVVLLPSFYETVLNIFQSSINAMSMLQRYNFKGTGAWLDPQHCVSPGRRLPRFLFTTSRLVWPFSGNVKNVLPAQSTRGARTHPKVAEWIRLISIVFNYC